jgi:hypothetical protein
VRAAITALGRIAKRQEETFIAARQRLKPDVARRRKCQRVARQVAWFGVIPDVGLNQALMTKNVWHSWHRGQFVSRFRYV